MTLWWKKTGVFNGLQMTSSSPEVASWEVQDIIYQLKRTVGFNAFIATCSHWITPGYFVIIAGAEYSTVYACVGSHLYVFYLKTASEMPAIGLTLEENGIPPSSVFYGNGYIQNSDLGQENTWSPESYLLHPSAEPFKRYNFICLWAHLLLSNSLHSHGPGI